LPGPLDEIHTTPAIHKEVFVEEIDKLRIVFVADNPFAAGFTHGRHGGHGTLGGLSGRQELFKVLAAVMRLHFYSTMLVERVGGSNFTWSQLKEPYQYPVYKIIEWRI
jgi:hypothetical protein